MRKMFLMVCAAAFVLLGIVGASLPAMAGRYLSNGTYTGTPRPAVAALFARFPNGGQGLTDAITQLLIGNASLAADVVFVASKGNTAQQLAAGTGMGQAQAALSATGNPGAAALIGQAGLFGGNSTIQSAANAASGIGSGSAGFSFSSTEPSSNPLTGAGQNCATVSPSRPGITC